MFKNRIAVYGSNPLVAKFWLQACNLCSTVEMTMFEHSCRRYRQAQKYNPNFGRKCVVTIMQHPGQKLRSNAVYRLG